MPPKMLKRRKSSRRKSSSKRVKLAPSVKYQVQKLINKNIETKQAYKTYSTATYNVNDDMLVMASDVFGGIGQGALDSSSPASNNRIGDAVTARGVLFNFRIVARPVFITASNTFQLPWVSVRLMIFSSRASLAQLGAPTKAKCLDSQAMTVNLAPTQVPWSMTQYGYVKKVLYDKVIKIRNDGLFVNNSVITDPVLGNEYNFKKYLKLSKVIKYTDNVSGSPNETTEPIFFAILAETAPFLSTGLNTGTQPLCSISGYTKVYYKDA